MCARVVGKSDLLSAEVKERRSVPDHAFLFPLTLLGLLHLRFIHSYKVQLVENCCCSFIWGCSSCGQWCPLLLTFRL